MTNADLPAPAEPSGKPRSQHYTLLTIVLANGMPLAGFVVLEWHALDVLIVYWLETVAVGIWAIPRILTARGPRTTQWYLPHPSRSTLLWAFFFCYVLVALIQGAALLFLLGEQEGAMSYAEIPAPAYAGFAAIFVFLLASHGQAYRRDWHHGRERDHTGPGIPWLIAVGRVLLLQAPIVLLVYLMEERDWGTTAVSVAALTAVALKTLVELVTWWWLRRRLGPLAPSETPPTSATGISPGS